MLKEGTGGAAPIVTTPVSASNIDAAGPAAPVHPAKQLMQEEEREKGAVKVAVYRKYFMAGGGVNAFVLVFCAFFLSQLASSMNKVRPMARI